jgi:protein CWC15
MTTAHRPTFDPARGKEALRGPAYHQRLQPAYTQLKFRKAGQGGDAETEVRDLRAELIAAEKAHFAKVNGGVVTEGEEAEDPAKPAAIVAAAKRKAIEAGSGDGNEAAEEDPEAKRRRILEDSREIDADDSDDSEEADDDSEEEDSDDEDAELLRELEKIKRERAEKREKEEREKAAAEEEERVKDIARGNPLLNKTDFNLKRRYESSRI